MKMKPQATLNSNNIATPKTLLYRNFCVSTMLLFCQYEGVKHFQLLLSFVYRGEESTVSCHFDSASLHHRSGRQDDLQWASLIASYQVSHD